MLSLLLNLADLDAQRRSALVQGVKTRTARSLRGLLKAGSSTTYLRLLRIKRNRFKTFPWHVVNGQINC